MGVNGGLDLAGCRHKALEVHWRFFQVSAVFVVFEVFEVFEVLGLGVWPWS